MVNDGYPIYIWQFNLAMENTPFLIGKYRQTAATRVSFSIAMLNKMVVVLMWAELYSNDG